MPNYGWWAFVVIVAAAAAAVVIRSDAFALWASGCFCQERNKKDNKMCVFL